MSNFELIDDYLTGRLSQVERQAFEKEISSNPALKTEVKTQQLILDGIKNARKAELKTMLSNVPIDSTPTSLMNPLRIAAGVIGVALVASAILYFNNDNYEIKNNAPVSDSINDSITESINPAENKTQKTDSLVKASENNTLQPVEKTTKEEVKKSTKSNTAEKPKIDLIDPSHEITEDVIGANIPTQTKVNETPAKVEVEVDELNKKFNFHYQFQNGKLRLYGNFKNGLYEIIEINSGQRALFLYYRDGYYMLDERKTEITPLELIKDDNLLSKLKSYRDN